MDTYWVTQAHAWVLTRKWALSIRLSKTVIWALTREWMLARDTTVLLHVHKHVGLLSSLRIPAGTSERSKLAFSTKCTRQTYINR